MKKAIALILVIVMVLTMAVSVSGESFQDYVTYHKTQMWLPEESHVLYEEEIDLESISIYNLYPSTARVIEVNQYEDIVKLFDGINVWILEGSEDWEEGDLVSLLMFDAFTGGNVKDDMIVLAWYAGNI